MDNKLNRIISPDTQRANRLPPGQVLTEKFPVMHHGSTQKIDPEITEKLNLIVEVSNQAKPRIED